MNTTTTSNSSALSGDRALVLGGGGSTGNAWLIGIMAGLAEAGLDVTGADLTVGTSAGSTAAAQVANTGLAELYAAALVAPPARQAPAPDVGARPNGLDRITSIIDASSGAEDLRRRMSASALDLDADSDGSWSARWRGIVAARLPEHDWPERSVQITAVDARTGEGVVFDRHSGVDLVDAVAASCSSGLPYRIGDEFYIDGGFRTNAENADLATGFGRVLVLSPFGGRSLTPPEWGLHLATQVEALEAGGSRVETVGPDSDSEHLFGPNGMDLSLRPAAARAGYEQGRALAPDLAAFWG